MRSANLALAALSLLGVPLGAQRVRPGLPGSARDTAARRALGTVDGVVTDTNLTPLGAAQVTVLSTSLRVGTGPNGRFRITQLPAGQYVLIVRRAGYRPTSNVVQIATSDTLRVAYSLEKSPNTLEPVVITAEARSIRMAEFERRRKVGVGEFMTAEQIARRNPVYATELIRNFQSINVSPSYGSGGGGLAQYFALSKRETANPNVGACPMTVVVDNVPMPTPFNLDLLPSPKILAGIEVYNGPATIPPQFAGYNRTCGVVLIWTKDGS